ncbi:hypothetical protein [Bdellovibrio sp. HCB2-146]|uniref:hypothetical protein n=1 Tax=Bdellovibrio sp. HCB2-146 TaxID=3394362 RepID=UPI0039BD68DA
MKTSVVGILLLILLGCSHSAPKRGPEVVASCFSDGEEQEPMCKSQRVAEDSRIVVTRCIGANNRLALANLRGKCVEKICPAGSNTDCETRGEIAVLGAYAELVRGKLFAEDETPAAATPAAPAKKMKNKKGKGKKLAAVNSVEAEIDVDPNARLPVEPEKEEPAPAAVTAKAVKQAPAAPVEPPQMNVVLKPAAKKARGPSSVAKPQDGFQRVCVAKADTAAPENLRGKCAIRNCDASGKCTYKGRKEMFDWVAANRAG